MEFGSYLHAVDVILLLYIRVSVIGCPPPPKLHPPSLDPMALQKLSLLPNLTPRD